MRVFSNIFWKVTRYSQLRSSIIRLKVSWMLIQVDQVMSWRMKIIIKTLLRLWRIAIVIMKNRKLTQVEMLFHLNYLIHNRKFLLSMLEMIPSKWAIIINLFSCQNLAIRTSRTSRNFQNNQKLLKYFHQILLWKINQKKI